MTHHSSVNYVEPNLISNGPDGLPWKVDDNYERAPRLEDYCIMVNLEVEVCSRVNISQSTKTSSEVLIMSYSSKGDGSPSTVNFMGGTKISPGKNNIRPIPFLTTHYADMYVGDLVNYGTTEMIGIKSIDIEYQKSCVPIISIVFTDVRGLSLFQPTELSRANSYQGIGGINADNVAQSFFQCFFKLPMPRFTITIKGFYGKPVTYEVLCDKFDTKFNSATGDFEVNTRFIGYSYSFLTDISMDALMAAPYSDYQGGKDYWESQQASGRFTIWNKEKTKPMKMPTLFEIWHEMNSITASGTTDETSLTIEESTHDNEIAELTELMEKFKAWYNELYELCCAKYGKKYCYLFKEDGDDGEPYGMLILTDDSTKSRGSLAYDYENFPDSFKQTNRNLYAAVETYNGKSSGFKKLDNVSLNLDNCRRVKVFNNCFLNGGGDIIFNGFDNSCKLSKTQVTKHVFYGVEYTGYDEIDIKEKETQHKKHILGIIYGNGVNQYTSAFSVEVDYRSIRDRIKALQADANRSDVDKMNQKRLKELNKRMFDKMSWYPTVENFTKIILAHLETLMCMMYKVVDECGNRTASDLGVTTGENGNLNDVRSSEKNVPPFPRVTRNITGDDNITKVEDVWLEEFNGEKTFAEVNFINGLFNAAERIEALYKDQRTIAENMNGGGAPSEQVKPIIQHPLSSFDLYMTRSPYGDADVISNDETGYHFSGKVAIRMANILGLNNFRNENEVSGLTTHNGDLIRTIARTEAKNFSYLVSLTNSKFLEMIRNGVFDSKTIINKITTVQSDARCPWGTTKSLFENGDKNNFRLSRYSYSKKYTTKDGKKGTLYYNLRPIQGYEFNDIDTDFKSYKQGKLGVYNGKISLDRLPSECSDQLPNDLSGFGNLVILDDFASVEEYIQGGNSSNTDDNGYTTLYEKIQSACTFDDNTYNSFITSFNKKESSVTDKINKSGLGISDTSNFASEAKTGSFSSYVIRGVFKDGRGNLTKLSKVNGRVIDDNKIKLTLALMSIRINSINIQNYLIGHKTVSYIPKLAALQLGAIVYQGGGFQNNEIVTKASERIQTQYYVDDYIDYLVEGGKAAYMNYYLNWLDNNTRKYSALDKYLIEDGKYLDTSKSLVKEFTNDLLSPVAVINLSKGNLKKNRAASSYSFNESAATLYLNEFMEELKKIYNIDYTDDGNGNKIKTVDEPHRTTNDMKIELYRYMKQIYDKWIPMSSFEDWKLSSFFINEENSEENGHKFYFIDSFYNDISDKLLVNPKTIADKVDAMLSYKDVSSMMLGFMADVYSLNKCMLMSIQNFADLKKNGCMDEMFTPMSYNSIKWNELNKYPSFVVVYPYSPSRNLDVSNGEYNNDSFMLNDEYDTPVPIRTKTDRQMKIPAFGVSYGKQYQSYFKSVNVNMQSPVQTEQSIKAKHFIIREAQSPKDKAVTAQDLYDVYSTQSYTCEVEMMGCAWVQPLMYFVLLNVPMFKGSYMIMKVKHSIRPGDMTTVFTGCRMANTSNHMVEDIFTDDVFGGDASSYSGYEGQFYEKADIDNDCPYKIYPLFSEADIRDIKSFIKHFEGGYGDVKHDKGGCTNSGVTIDTFRRLIDKNATCENVRNMTESQWDKVLDHVKKECKADQIKDVCVRNAIIDFKWGSGKALLKIKEMLNAKYGKTLDDKNTFDDATITAINDIITNEKKGRELFYDIKEARLQYLKRLDDWQYFGKGWEKRVNSLKYGVDNDGDTSTNVHTKYNTALFNALNDTCMNTPSIGIKLKYARDEKRPEYGYTIVQNDGKRDKLHLVFDVLLNSEYHQYISELIWVYEKGAGSLNSNTGPFEVHYKAAQSVEPNKQRVYVMEKGSKTGIAVGQKIDDISNELLLKSLGKRLAAVGDVDKFKTEIPQITDTTKKVEKYKPQDCKMLFGSLDSSLNLKDPSSVDPGDEGYIEGWNVGEACAFLITNARSSSTHKCASYVEDAIAYGGKKGVNCPLKNRMFCGGNGQATRLRYKGILEKNGFVCIATGEIGNYGTPNMSFQSGDVSIIGKGTLESPYHAVMYTSRGWISDFKQNGMSPYSTVQPYAVYRYKNKIKTKNPPA